MTKEDIKKHHRDITKVCIKAALLLLQHGMESAMVVQLTSRLGKALGLDSVECALTPNAVIVTTIVDGICLTTMRNNADQGINMKIVTDVHHLVIVAEHKLYDWRQISDKLDKIKPAKYNRYLVMIMVGLSCGSFAHLAGGDWMISLITFIASSIAMWVRQSLAMRHLNPIIVFSATALVASLIAGQALKYQLGNNPQIALASSVLLLVPGFPLVNSLSDILKGYISMGIARWVLATVLTFGACLGIVFALSLLHITHWGA